jgi:integrase
VIELLEGYARESDKGPEARLNLSMAVIVAIDTGLRVAEIRQLRWDEITFGGKPQIWVPKERAKSGRDRWVPLLPRTLTLLKRMHGTKKCQWVFPNDTNDGPRVNFDKALRHFAGSYPDKTGKRIIDGPVVMAGLKPFSWHDSSITVTERHYAVGSLHEAVETEESMTQEMTQDAMVLDPDAVKGNEFIGTASPDRTGDL